MALAQEERRCGTLCVLCTLVSSSCSARVRASSLALRRQASEAEEAVEDDFESIEKLQLTRSPFWPHMKWSKVNACRLFELYIGFWISYVYGYQKL